MQQLFLVIAKGTTLLRFAQRSVQQTAQRIVHSKFTRWRIWRPFVYSAEVYCGVIAGFLALRLVMDDHAAMIGLFNNMLPMILLPAVLLVPLAMLFRNRRLAMLAMPAFMTFGLSYFGLFFPHHPAYAPDAALLSVMTFNTDGETRYLETLARIIESTDTDIVALQELSIEAADFLSDRLADAYPYQALYPQPDTIIGQGIFSRYPLVEEETWVMNARPGFQRVLVNVDDAIVAVYNIHPDTPIMGFNLRFDVRPRESQIQEVVARARSETVPVIMLGDFNLTDQSDDYGRITRFFTDAHRAVGRGLGLTFPDLRHVSNTFRVVPLMARPDYIFFSHDLLCVQSRVWPQAGGSDHRPVIARFVIRAGEI